MDDRPTIAEKPKTTTRKRLKSADARLQALAGARVAIEGVSPEIDCGRFPARAVVGDLVSVEADVFCDGHDVVDAALLYKAEGGKAWSEAPMAFLGNDRWRGGFEIGSLTPHVYTIIAWRDTFAAWRRDTAKKVAAGQDVGLELTEARLLLEAAIEDGERASAGDKRELKRAIKDLGEKRPRDQRLELALGEELFELMKRAGPRVNLTVREKELTVLPDRERAAFSAWYELFPRSQSDDASRHGSFDDVIRRLPYVREMGFDVLYFPPIHPIGETNRKGRNNSLVAGENDPGSPYAIGSSEGGHDALHPELGSFADFRRLVKAADEHGLEIAIDFAIQCSPDHPWIKQHPEWFDWRPDGTIKFAENPPKKYEDIVNVHFYRQAIPSLWHELRDVVLFWVKQGVKIFRVDNPHTKPFPFWEWMIGEVRTKHPDAIFLAEAFTRPKVMKRLAKVGFNQSYSYFTWRNTKAELTEYLTELTREECADYMRVNFFANTPDINPVYLQTSGRAGFRVRALLAGTLAGNYGLYSGFELCEGTPVTGKEEYLDSEKYEIRAWDWDREGHIRDDIRFINAIRRDNAAMRDMRNLRFYNAFNDNVLYYGRATPDLESFLLFAVNLDPRNAQSAAFEVPLWEFGLPDDASIEADDLITGEPFTWHGKTQEVWLDPRERPYCVWRLKKPPRMSAEDELVRGVLA